MRDSNDYAAAKARAEAKFGFYRHLAIYAVVMVLLIVINLITYSDTYWSIWPFIGWGAAVALHGLRVFFMAEKSAIIDQLTEDELRKSDEARSGDVRSDDR